MSAPSGTLTFLFTDLEGSTPLWAAAPDAMNLAVEQHDAMIRSLVEQHSGYVFTTAGDSFAVAFSRSDDALRCAVEIQRAAGVARWPEGAELRIRIGLHSGEAHERDGDYFGPPINKAARIMGIAAGGQVVASAAVRAVLGDSVRDELSLSDLGRHELKGFDAQESIFQVRAPGLADEFPPLRSGPSRGNLPDQEEQLIGRDRDSELLRRLMGSSRLTTIVGARGIGKTRLAVSVASAVSGNWSDGAWLVELAPIGDGASLAQAIADAIGCRQHVGLTLTESVVEFFAPRDALLVLDNCEHVIDAASDFVATLLGAAPGVHVLATSREAMGLRAERAYSLPSLSVGAGQADGEALFAQRAAEVAGEATWDDDQLAAVSSICARLDGIPLAIELAASRCRSATPVDIAAKLESSFLSLRGGRRSVERHRTLRAAIDWSHESLAASERAAFARLSVFAGGWDLEAAEAVAGGDDVDPSEVFDLLDSLVARSLVVASVGVDGRSRYRMLEPVRQFAEDQLVTNGASLETREAHVAWMVKWAAEWGGDLPREDTSWRDRLVETMPNLRAAFEFGAERHLGVELVSMVENLMPGVQWLQIFEIGYWAERALAIPAFDDQPRAAVVHAVAGAAAFWRGDSDSAQVHSANTLALASSDSSMFYPAATIATGLNFARKRQEATERLMEGVPRTWAEEAAQHYLRSAFNLDQPQQFDDSISALERLAVDSRSGLPLAIRNNQVAHHLLVVGPIDGATDLAWKAYDEAMRLGATFLAIQAVARLARAADANGIIEPRVAVAAGEMLREMRDSGQHLDQWLMMWPFAYPLWRLGHRRLARQLSAGYSTTTFAGAELEMAQLPLADRAEFLDELRSPVEVVPQSELLREVLTLLDEIASESTAAD